MGQPDRVSTSTSTNINPQKLDELRSEGRQSAEPRASSSVFPFDGGEDAPRESTGSDNYPTWLPKRPGPPMPMWSREPSAAGLAPNELRSSNEESSSGNDANGSGSRARRRWAHKYGRKPADRAVRVVALPPDHRDPAGLAARSRNVVFQNGPESGESSPPSTSVEKPRVIPALSGPRPRFRVPGLHLDLIRFPSPFNRLLFVLFPIIVFAHIPVQAFLDYNAVLILLQLAKHPTMSAPGSPASGRNWALASAAYFACYFIYFFAIFIGYEVAYSFYRRWRAVRPLVIPVYLSAPASRFAALASYSHFCFFQYVFLNSFKTSEHGSIKDGIAETCWFLSQNLPTIILLMPRAALCLAVVLTFSSPSPASIANGNAGTSQRDSTYFKQDGVLTPFSRGILISNAAWTAWRTLVLILSWIGLWTLSGQACGGLCGPRLPRDENDQDDEKELDFPAYVSRNDSIVARWPWLPRTTLRIQDAYELCLISRPRRRASAGPIDISHANNKQRKRSSLPPTLPPLGRFDDDGFAARGSRPSGTHNIRGVGEESRPLTDPITPLTGTTPADTFAGIQAVAPVAGPSGSRSHYRQRSALDNDMFNTLALAGAPSPSEARNMPPVSASYTTNTIMPTMPAPTHSSPTLGKLSTPFQPTTGLQPLPFPSRTSAETRRSSDSAVRHSTSLTPPSASLDDDYQSVEERDNFMHHGDDDDAPHGLEGFVVDDTEELPPPIHDLQLDLTGGFRSSTDAEGSGSISSLGQPMFARYAFRYPPGATPDVTGQHGDSAPGTRSQSFGSQHSPLSGEPSPQTDQWSSSVSRSPSAGLESPPPNSAAIVNIPPPRRHPSAGSGSELRRRRAVTGPSLPSASESSDAIERARQRNISLRDHTFGIQNPLPPVLGTHEHGPDAEGEMEHKSGDVEDEKADSVGLLSNAPSRKSSVAVLRQRRGSLVSSRRRGSTGSHSSAAAEDPRIRPMSLGATRFPFRQHSGPSNTSSPFPRVPSPIGSTTSFDAEVSEERTYPNRVAAEDDDTFGFSNANPPVNWDRVPRLSSTGRPVPVIPGPPPPLPPPPAPGSRGLRPVNSQTTFISDVTASQAPPPTDISEAPSSYVTVAPTINSTSSESRGGTVRSHHPLDDVTRDVM